MRTLSMIALVLATSNSLIFAQQMTKSVSRSVLTPGYAGSSDAQPPAQGTIVVPAKPEPTAKEPRVKISAEAAVGQGRCAEPLVAVRVNGNVGGEFMPGAEGRGAVPKVTPPTHPCDTVSTAPMLNPVPPSAKSK